VRTLLHSDQDGIWQKKPFLEQMANIGSEVFRAINWRKKGSEREAEQAFTRSLELFDLTKEAKLTGPQYQELCRCKEMWVDYFKYDNIYKSSAEFFNNYFMYLTIAYKKNPK